MTDQPLDITIRQTKLLIQSEAKRFQAALAPSRHVVQFEPWYAAVIADFERQKNLQLAAVQAPDTVLDALTVAANCGLVPGSAHGQFYLIPRWSGARQCQTCTFIVGYKGLTDMAYRHPRVHKCEAFLVYEGEQFEWEPGAGKLVHKWSPAVVRNDDKVIAAYSRVVLTVSGGTHVDQEPLVQVMTRDEILAVRDRSDAYRAWKAGKIKSTPWDTDAPAMMRKTVMRKHQNGGSIPRSADLILAIAAEGNLEERLLAEDTAALHNPVGTASDRARQALGLAPAGVEIPQQQPAAENAAEPKKGD